MKTILKVIGLLLLGGGGGFFSGYAIGHRKGRNVGYSERKNEEQQANYVQVRYGNTKGIALPFKPPINEIKEFIDNEYANPIIKTEPPTAEAYRRDRIRSLKDQERNLKDEVKNQSIPFEPYGMDTDGDKVSVSVDIPQLHPQDMEPHPITEDEFNLNVKGYEIRDLNYYELDEVVYDQKDEETINDPESLLGIGFWAGFNGDPNNPVETLYIESDVMGTLYRVNMIHEAFCDAVMGYFPPEEEEDDEE